MEATLFLLFGITCFVAYGWALLHYDSHEERWSCNHRYCRKNWIKK